MNRTLIDLDRVVAIGGGHGLGRVMSSLAVLGSRLTGIVTTTDNGGSTGRIRQSEGGIAWGDMRNCINQLIAKPGIAAAMFEYRFSGQGELAGYNLGNLMLKALDNLSVRPLEAINLIRNVLKIEAYLVPMSEQPADLVATDSLGNDIDGETAIDAMASAPEHLWLNPKVPATPEALEAIEKAELILLGPGSFFTSLMPVLLLDEIATALRRTQGRIVFIDNLAAEHSPAGAMSIEDKLNFMAAAIGQNLVDAIITTPAIAKSYPPNSALIISLPLEADDYPYRHDRERLRYAIEHALQQINQAKSGQ
jgi:uncharacterized cofD-like protein